MISALKDGLIPLKIDSSKWITLISSSAEVYREMVRVDRDWKDRCHREYFHPTLWSFLFFKLSFVSDKATDATPMASTLQARRFARPYCKMTSYWLPLHLAVIPERRKRWATPQSEIEHLQMRQILVVILVYALCSELFARQAQKLDWAPPAAM